MTGYYNFYSTVVPLGPIMGLIARVVWGAFMLLVGYALGHAFMWGLGALWRRR